MTFEPTKVDEFMDIFKGAQHLIEAFPGCKGVDLCRDIKQENVLITLSIWENIGFLDAYRNSDLFKTTWEATKKLFIERADARSLEKLM